MTELRAFNNPEFRTIRTIVDDGKRLFCGRDVANVLGYSDPKKAIARHCKGGMKRPLPTVVGMQEAIFIPEADHMNMIEAVYMVFLYGQAKGYRAAKAEE